MLRQIAASGALVLSCAAHGAVLQQTTRVAQHLLYYAVVLPDHFDPQLTYPAILAFGGGSQEIDVVQRTVERTFRTQAEKRGYIVVLPAAPPGQLFFETGARIFPEFLQQMLSTYKVEGGKFLAAGASNGGTSAFHIAALYPEYFRSITAFPGYLPGPTPARVNAIAGLCIHMFVGEHDELGFDRPMNEDAQLFRQKNMAVTYSVEQGQPHSIASLAGDGAARLFDLFDQDRKGCARR